MTASRIVEVSTISAKGQTTVPKAVRQALGVGYGGRIAFALEKGRVTVHAVPDVAGEDPALAPFLALLERDINDRPEALQPLPAELVGRMEALVADMADMGDLDIHAPIEGEVSL